MEQQEYFMRMQMIEQEAGKLDQQIQAIDQQIQEIQAIKASLEELDSTKEKEILANLGKGIFIKAEIKDKELFVNVGKEALVRKTPRETINIIESQMDKLMNGKTEFTTRIGDLQGEMQSLMETMRRDHENKNKSDKTCDDEDCECESPCEDCSCAHEHHEKKQTKKK